jgi:Fic/DOC family
LVADWDANSRRLRENLTRTLRAARDSARRRDVPTIELARAWQRDTMAGLDVPSHQQVGRFRGEPGLKRLQVHVGSKVAVSANSVVRELAAFEGRLQRVVAALDARYPSARKLDPDGLAAVIDLSAWVHAEWVRIHPFANGNGRTARIWANYVFMRYGVPPVVRLRPRPAAGYGAASARAMDGDWKPTAVVFTQMLLALPASETPAARPPRRK